MAAKARQDRLDGARLLTDLDDPMDRAAFAHRHLLANAITGAGLQDVRHYLVDLMPGDRLVLDSDGIHDNLTSAELEAALSELASAPEAAEQVVSEAWHRSEDETEELGRAKPDDMTILVLDVREIDAHTPRPGPTAFAREARSACRSAPPASSTSSRPPTCSCSSRCGTASGGRPSRAPLPAIGLVAAASWAAGRVRRHEPGGFLVEPSDQVSRRHMALGLSEASDMLTVSDLTSTNGTAVIGW